MENVPPSAKSDCDRQTRPRLRWLLGREPRIVDYIAIAVIAPLLVAGILWIVGVATGGAAKRHEHLLPPQSVKSTSPTQSPSGVGAQGEATTGLAEPVYLDDLPKQNGAEYELGPVSIDGHVYQHGVQFEVNWIGTEWEVNYTIPHGAHTFTAIIGNAEHQSSDLWMYMSLLYEVFADGQLVGSGHVKGYSHDGPIHADIAGKTRLTLKVTVISGSDSTTADWAEPVFH
jgi:NPCBM/NEW2 domain